MALSKKPFNFIKFMTDLSPKFYVSTLKNHFKATNMLTDFLDTKNPKGTFIQRWRPIKKEG